MDGWSYTIRHGDRALTLPRVTTVLGVLDKSGPLMGWAVKLERAAMLAALEDALTTPHASIHDIHAHVLKTLKGKRASLTEQDRAADIGKQAHRWIEWHTRRLLGERNDEPTVSDPAMSCCLAWMEWARAVDFTPITTEQTVYCEHCCVAGTLDSLAKVQGVISIIDYKSSRAIYPESLLQVNFYKHMAAMRGIDAEQAMVVRLPKESAHGLDPEPRVAPVIPLRHLQSILSVWRLMRWMRDEPFGDTAKMCGGGVTVRVEER